MNRRWAVAALAVTAATITGACKEPPVPGRVAIAGDSLTVLASMHGGGLGDWDDYNKIGIGWQAEHAQVQLDLDVEDPNASPAVLVIALGQNDAARSWGRDGFTQQDRDQLARLAETPADGACVAWVKPWYQPPEGQSFDAAQMEGILAYRDWVDQQVVMNPVRYRSVDWRPTVEAHPEYLDLDGIHEDVDTPADPEPAAVAYLDLLHAGAAACGAGG